MSRSLTALRCSHDVTQAELAERAGCTQSKISRIENSPNDRLKLEDLAMYARAFNMRVSFDFERVLPAADAIGGLARQIRTSLDYVDETTRNDGAAERGAERTYEEFLFQMLDLFMEKLEALRSRRNGSAESGVATRAENGRPEDPAGKSEALTRGRRENGFPVFRISTPIDSTEENGRTESQPEN